ncbi:MAG: D-alanyl-D-alanine carboxypeptidase family protein [Clostridia bacterium]|nr:D-alanyl-D-alanine carboxypeptidase family protein [Clostridia bacterium]
MADTKKNSNSFISTFLIVFFALAAIICAAFAIDFFTVGGKESAFTYTIGESEYTLSADEAYSGKTLLVCFDDIASLCEMTETGSAKERTFFAQNSDQSITLREGSTVAVLNGSKVDMLSSALLRDGKLYVPLAFVEEYMAGISVEAGEKSVKISRGVYNASTKDNPLYVDTSFEATEQIVLEADEPEKVAPTYSFITDLSAYEQYMCPEDIDGFLVLVNREETINREYVPDNLVDIRASRSDRTERMVETAENALQALYIEMRAAGYTDVSVTSGYRSYDKQEYLYNLYTEKEMGTGLSREAAQKVVDTYSARPGTSEHQTGLCVDMHNLGSADVAFAKKAAYKWLIENCYKFGFILRFPEGKEDITGYSFEPWHYRFVGRYHASEMHRLGMCLEEYIEHLGE